MCNYMLFTNFLGGFVNRCGGFALQRPANHSPLRSWFILGSLPKLTFLVPKFVKLI